MEVPVQYMTIGSTLSTHRFVIVTGKEAAPFYREKWLLGEGGNVKHDSGVDLPLPVDTTFPPGQVTRVGMGIRVRSFTYIWAGSGQPTYGMPSAFEIVPRSSMSKPGERVLLLTNSPGLIDVGYEGELMISVLNLMGTELTLKAGTSLVQIVHPSRTPTEYVSCLPDTALESAVFPGSSRGAGGFGSTGESGGASVQTS